MYIYTTKHVAMLHKPDNCHHTSSSGWTDIITVRRVSRLWP